MFQSRHILATSLHGLLALICLASTTTTSPAAAAAAAAASVGTLTAAASFDPGSNNAFGDSLKEQLTQNVVQQINYHTPDQHQQQTQYLSRWEALRRLQSGDFARFVDLVSGAVVNLPDFQASETILFADLNIRATNVRCYNIILKNVNVTYDLESQQRLAFGLAINELDITCQLDYVWNYSFLSGDGEGTIDLNDNYVSSTLAFLSEDFAFFPPASSEVVDCNAQITVTDMAFSGSVTDTILNVFESLLRGFVEDAVEELICVEVGSLGTSLIQDMIDQVAGFLDPYLQPMNQTDINATAAELALVVPENVNLMDFQDEGDDQMWFYGALKEIDTALGVWLIDPDGPRPGGKDLGVNIALRENILDEERAFVLNVADLPFDFDPVLFEGHDSLTETVISLDTVRIYGLDTFNELAGGSVSK